jgi:hypothetical protein
VRHKKEEDPNNPFLRSLFLAAFLRCIYALLERPAETKVKDLMIEKLIEKNNLREITKFCETCISGEFNIPSKFISIVKFIVLNGNKNKNQFLNKNNNNYNNNSNSNNNKKNNSPNLYSNKSLNKKYHDSNKDSEDEDIENEEDKGLNKIEYEKIEDKNNMYIANLLKTILMKMKGKLTIEKDDDKILLNNICECAKALVMNIDYNHMEIDRISKNYINISKKYILSRKLKDYCDIIIIETFLEVIKEYMFLENLYFKKNSRSKEKDNEPKNANNPNQNGNGENFLLALNNNNEKDDIENEDILLLNERFEESNQIKILKIFANINEVENSEPGAFFKVDEYLLNLISYIPLILGEYMSKCSDETVSEIFEFFSRSSVFHGVNIRKSYIKEIIDLMNISKKNKLMSKEHINQFITRVNKIDFEKKDNKWCLLFVQENDLKLIPINENDNEKDDLINKDKLSLENEKEDDLINEITRKCIFNNEDENKISYDIITHIFVFELRNLLIFRLQKEKAVYKLIFFKRFYIAEIICNYIKMKKCNVKIIMDIPVFLNDEELSKLKEPDNIKEKILSNEKKLNQENFERKIIQDENETPENDNYNKNNKSTPTPIEENKNSTPSNSNNNDKEIKKMEEKAEKLINENEEEKKNLEKIQEEKRIKNFKKDPNETVIMYCNIPMSSFFDFFLNLFRNKKDIEESNINNLKEMRILKVNGQKFEIYDEISDNFFEMNFQKFNEETPIYEITTEIKKCFTLRESIDMSEFSDVEYKYNSVTINFNGKKFEINCFDDFSLIKLKTCLFYHKMKDVSIINKEDYSIIDKKA